MTVGENIKRVRKEKGLTQKELGKRCGLADSAVRRYELGGANPKIETIKRIADALQVNVRELMEDDGWFRIEAETGTAHDCGNNERSRLWAYYSDCMRRFGQAPVLEILENLKTLNFMGQKEASKRVEELTRIPQYTKKDA